MFGSDDDQERQADSDYECEKCGASAYETTTIATAGSGMQKILDVDSQKFEAVICQNCGYSEFYEAESSKLEDIADFMT